ncbi:NUDIX hydrolase [Advenella incenata]|nr:NUDIX domain-containing protein [Advenella incenata]
MQSIVDVHVLFFNEQDECLFIRRANTGYKDGQYSLVAGHLEPGETIKGCAVREAAEEVGAIVDANDLVLSGVMRRDADQNRISFFLTCHRWQGQIINNEPDKCDDLVWQPLPHLPDPMVDYVQEALKSICKSEILSDFIPG